MINFIPFLLLGATVVAGEAAVLIISRIRSAHELRLAVWGNVVGLVVLVVVIPVVAVGYRRQAGRWGRGDGLLSPSPRGVPQ